MKKLLTQIKCWFVGHKWTCRADKGIQPSQQQIRTGMIGFKEYSTMYCDRCGKISELNKRLQP